MGSCAAQCPQLATAGTEWDYKDNFYVESCPNEEVITSNKYCVKCNELTPGCSVCSDYDYADHHEVNGNIHTATLNDQDVCL